MLFLDDTIKQLENFRKSIEQSLYTIIYFRKIIDAKLVCIPQKVFRYTNIQVAGITEENNCKNIIEKIKYIQEQSPKYVRESYEETE